MVTTKQIRDAILHSSLETSNDGTEPTLGTLYVPPSHLKALKLEASVVIGGRGVGKSFWTAALKSLELRKTIGPDIRELDELSIHVGFSNAPSLDYPQEDSFAQMLNQGYDSYDIWRAVILRWVANGNNASTSIPSNTWQETIEWLKEKPEEPSKLMLEPRSWKGLVLFDALDRTSKDWQQMDDIVRGLLKAILWLKPYTGLYGKVFLRDDQAERTVFNFPDASKLKATKAELTWARHDLHGLLWQRLINTPEEHGTILRSLLENISNHKITEVSGVWQLPDDMKRETELQRKAFEVLAGPWMGKDRRRGVPYTWSVNHLSDGRGQASPRSFLSAIKQATEDSLNRYPEHDTAIHYESIKRGIQNASEIRVDELAEDYPWIKSVLEPLSGVNVPCEYSTLLENWNQKFPKGPSEIEESDRLPAQHVERGWDGITQDLQRLGLLETKKDGRIDMPDLFRVGFQLGRRGGVKPKSQ
ncbi:hypothetical protein O1D11_003216 [Vibrio cholerae]|nr:hypothetical protein [Vibrio cholerae]